jgi:photosystem II stability/assembly factor-like uncharacterized protein
MIYFKAVIIFVLVNYASLAFAQTKEKHRWEKVTLGGGGAVPAIIAHPKVSGCVFSTHDVCGPNRWNESKQQFEYALSYPYWISPQSNAGCECLTLDPNDPEGNTALLSITNQADFSKESYLLRTTNRGITWENTNFRPVAGSEQFNARYHIQYDPNNSNVVYYAARNGGIYQSADGGINFLKTSAPDGLVNELSRPKSNTGIRKIIVNPYLGIVTNPVRSRVLYAEVATQDWLNYMIESFDGGLTWHKISMPVSPKFEVGPSGRVYLAGDKKTGFWEDNKFTPFAISGNSISVDPGNEDRIVVYKNLGNDTYEFYYSENRGVDWKTLKPVYEDYPYWYKNNGGCTAPQKGCSNPIDGSFTFDANGRLWYSDWYQIWRCDNLNNSSVNITFTGVVKGEEETVNIGDGLASPWGGNCKVMIGVADVGGFLITDLGKFPEKTALTPGHNIIGMDWAGKNPDKLVFVAANGWGWDHIGWGGFSEDGGLTAKYFKTRPNNGSMLCSRVAINADGTRIFWYSSQGLFYSDNSGDTWKKASNLSFGYESIFEWKGYRAIAADRINTNLIYLNNNDKLYRSDDNGINWSLVNSASIGSLFVNPEVEGEIWIMSWDSNGGNIKRSTNKGTSFTKIPNASDVKSFGFGRGPVIGQPSIYMIGKVNGNPGIYRSDNYGESWIRIDDLDQYPHPAVGSYIIGDGQVFGRVFVGSHSGTWIGSSLIQCDTCKLSNIPPKVNISVPTKTYILSHTAFEIKVNASDSDDGILKVELFIDEEKQGETIIAPYHFYHDGISSGSHLIQAKAWDNNGSFSLASITIHTRDSVLTANTPNANSITIDGIMDKEYDDPPGNLTKNLTTNPDGLSAKWSSCRTDGMIYFWISANQNKLENSSINHEFSDRIEISLLPNFNYYQSIDPVKIVVYPTDSTILYISKNKTDTISTLISVVKRSDGYDTELAIDLKKVGIVPVGRSYMGFDIKLFDFVENSRLNAMLGWNSNNEISRAENIGLIFLQPVNNKPFVKITAPFIYRIYTTKPLLIAIYADANDPDGKVEKVEFYANDSIIGVDFTAPFSIGNSSFPNGNYNLKAIAYDNDNEKFISEIVPIKVDLATLSASTENVEQVEIYPNPSDSGYFYLSRKADFTLMDPNGKILMSVKNSNIVCTKNLSKGVYFVKINNQEGNKVIVN